MHAKRAQSEPARTDDFSRVAIWYEAERQMGSCRSHFSRALAEGLNTQQSDAEFDAMLGASIENIYTASIT